MTATELRAARERLGLTQEDVADELGVDLRTYRRWENEERAISPLLDPDAAVMVLRLYRALGRPYTEDEHGK